MGLRESQSQQNIRKVLESNPWTENRWEAGAGQTYTGHRVALWAQRSWLWRLHRAALGQEGILKAGREVLAAGLGFGRHITERMTCRGLSTEQSMEDRPPCVSGSPEAAWRWALGPAKMSVIPHLQSSLWRGSTMWERRGKIYPGTSLSGSPQQNRCQSPSLMNSCSSARGQKKRKRA